MILKQVAATDILDNVWYPVIWCQAKLVDMMITDIPAPHGLNCSSVNEGFYSAVFM